MSRTAPPVWEEGILLLPQHFQQADRALRHWVTQRVRARNAYDYGVTRLDVSAEALRAGTLEMRAIAGILPDGTAFDSPDHDRLPPARDASSLFDPKRESIRAFVGLPKAATGRPQFGPDRRPPEIAPRFEPADDELLDDVTGSRPRTIRLASKSLTLLFEGESTGEYDCMPIAELVRHPQGGFKLSDRFVPPSLQLEAAPILQTMLATQLHRLTGMSAELSKLRKEFGQRADFDPTQISDLWRLGVVNGAIPDWLHLTRSEGVHPVTAYLSLARFVGQLCTQSTRYRAEELETYDHARLGDVFGRLHEWFDDLTRMAPVDTTIAVALRRRDEQVYEGAFADPRLGGERTRFFLGFRSPMAENEVRMLVSSEAVKVASPTQIDSIVFNAADGVPLRSASVPPTLRTTSGFLYFELNRNSERWSNVAAMSAVAIFVPSELKVGETDVQLLGFPD